MAKNRSRKTPTEPAAGSIMNMSTELAMAPNSAAALVPNGGDTEVINELMQDLEADANAAGEVLEFSDESDELVAVQPQANPASVIEHPQDVIDEVVGDAERSEAQAALYERQGVDEPTTDADTPATPPETVDPAATKEAKKVAAAAKREAARVKKAAERAAKPPRPTYTTHKPGDLLVAKMGEGYRDFIAFDVHDGDLDTVALEAKQNAFVERMNDPDAIADKVREKIVMLLTWLKAGAPDGLNEVLRRTFVVLHGKGELTSGDKGNLQLNLLAKPYSMGTARSQANQMFMALPEVGVTIKEKGRMVPNPNSTLLPMIYAKLGLPV